jgi:heme/copper-type cytochrome/quinol oxidase subunit 2
MGNEITNRTEHVAQGRLWFGVAASAAAWFVLGVADVLLTWAACLHREQLGGASSHAGILLLTVLITIVLFIIVLASGIVSYRNWRRLSADADLESAEGRGREEFMALLGVFVSLTLGFGVIWLALPLFILDLCVRTR